MKKDKIFAGKPIKYFIPNESIPDPTTEAVGLINFCRGDEIDQVALSIVSGSDTVESLELFAIGGLDTVDYMEAFFSQDWIHQTDTLVLHGFSYDMSDGFDHVVERIVKHKNKLPNLKAIFIGNVEHHESEITWIGSTNVSCLLESFPTLEILKYRGQGITFEPSTYASLKTLIIESGSLDDSTIENIMMSNFPNLEHLELWLGGNTIYNIDEEFKNLLTGISFPKLSYLGLRNSKNANSFVKELVKTSLLKQLKTLDLSLGNFSDIGAELIIYYNNKFTHLEILDLHFHYLSEKMMEALKALPIKKVNVSDPQEPDPDEYKDIDDWKDYVEIFMNDSSWEIDFDDYARFISE